MGRSSAAPLRGRKLAVVEPAGGLLGVVGEEDGGAGALDAGQDFEDDSFFVEPAFGYGGFYHGVFAAYVVGAYGNIEFVADGSNDVEIGEGGLDHYHVGAFFQVEGDFFQGFAGVGGIHLVGTAVAELRSGLRGFAEGAVEAGAVFGGVGKNHHVFEFVFVEFFADGGDASVHHVGRSDDVGAGAGMGQGLLGKNGDGGVVGNVAVLDDAAVTVIGVLAKANVGDDEKFEIGFADGFDGALDYSLGGERTRAARVLRFRKAEQDDSGNSEGLHFPALFDNLIRGLLINVRHGADFLADFAAGTDEHGIDEAGSGKLRFADKPAESFGAA